MKNTEKLEIILAHLNKVNFIPAYYEDYARQAIMKALREISVVEAEEEQAHENVQRNAQTVSAK